MSARAGGSAQPRRRRRQRVAAPRPDGQRGALARYLGAEERVLLATRQHPFALLRDFAGMLAWFTPMLLLTWGLAGLRPLRGVTGGWLLQAMFLLMALVVLGLMQRLLVWEFERVVVTNEKVIHLSGVLSRRIASTPLAKVSEFTVHQTLFGRLAGYGSLVVDVPGGRDQALHGLAFIPDPAGMYRLVSDQGRRVRRDEGGAAPSDEAAVALVSQGAAAPPVSHGPGGMPRPRAALDDDLDHTITIERPDSLR